MCRGDLLLMEFFLADALLATDQTGELDGHDYWH